MGTHTIVSGRIILESDIEKSIDFLKTLQDESYPWIRKEQFSLDNLERPFYYENRVIGLAASYKGLEYDWGSFIIKFENVLRQINFDNARVQIEAQFGFEDYVCTWISKQNNRNYDLQEDKLYETDEWFFGYGYRGRWGTLSEDLQEHQVFAPYPLVFDVKMLEVFNQHMLSHINATNDKVYYYTLISQYSNERGLDDKFDLIKTYLSINGEAEFGHDEGLGFWMRRLQYIEPLTNTVPRK